MRTNPVLEYIKELKGEVLDSEMLVRAEKCAKAEAKGKILKFDIGNAAIRGCLIREYKYNEKYIDKIADLISDAKENTKGIMQGYEKCVNNYYQCGKRFCNPSISLPQRTSFSLDGKRYRSIGYWNNGAKKTIFNCPINIPRGYELVIVSTNKQNIGRRRGACVTNNDYCNGHQEHCVEEYFSDACLVNKTWHDWYKKHSKETGIPYNTKTVCQ